MDPKKVSRLEQSGWRVGDAADFLGLTDAETAYVEMKVALGKALRNLRSYTGLTQAATAKVLGSSQSRVAKMEKGDPSVTLDLLLKTMLELGADAGALALVFDQVGTAASHAVAEGDAHWWQVNTVIGATKAGKSQKAPIPAGALI